MIQKRPHPAIAWREAVRDSDLPAPAKSCAQVLATYMNQQGECYVTLEDIAKGASLSIRTVKTHTAKLEKDGWIKRRANPKANGEWRNYITTLSYPSGAPAARDNCASGAGDAPVSGATRAPDKGGSGATVALVSGAALSLSGANERSPRVQELHLNSLVTDINRGDAAKPRPVRPPSHYQSGNRKPETAEQQLANNIATRKSLLRAVQTPAIEAQISALDRAIERLENTVAQEAMQA